MKNCLTDDEYLEYITLKNAISENPAYVHYSKMERFSDLYIKSLTCQQDYDKMKKSASKTL